MRRTLLLVLPALLALLAPAGPVAVADAAAAQAASSCPARAGTLAVRPLGRVWQRDGSLYACSVVYGRRPASRRLGPWSRGGQVAFDGVHVVWTRPLARGGRRSDRLWAAEGDTGRRWLEGKLAVPAAGPEAPEAEARVLRVVQDDRGAAWATAGGEVVLALRWPESTPEALGALPGPLPAPDGRRLLVGRFAGTDPAALAASLALRTGVGEGDECGGSNPYEVTVRPTEGAGPAGARWWGAWQSTRC